MGPALSRKIMSVLSQAESGDEDERTRYEITGIKGRVKSRARTGHRRNRNITIGINSVPRSASFRHLPGVSYRRPTSFFHPLARRPSSAKINRRFAIKISHGDSPAASRLKIPSSSAEAAAATAVVVMAMADPTNDGNNYAISENARAQPDEFSRPGYISTRIIKIFRRPVLDRASVLFSVVFIQPPYKRSKTENKVPSMRL